MQLYVQSLTQMTAGTITILTIIIIIMGMQLLKELSPETEWSPLGLITYRINKVVLWLFHSTANQSTIFRRNNFLNPFINAISEQAVKRKVILKQITAIGFIIQICTKPTATTITFVLFIPK